ncbi:MULTISPECIES: lysozyme inhibitor LprI family protein [unclassified Erwinia]|uniref:lysozyme inhibitor LprI family protein n=1 Tax=unclassified Erwinia TaxID=2622719 RepID=UPI00263A7D02|nr:lysozyme inhibitor LprI family protein [Erwinia sp. PsM31]MDN4629547.1 DUF1311 domain-containing protein [Erwinia sp. PsM31]
MNKQFAEAKEIIEHAYRSHEVLGRQYFGVLLEGQRGWLKYREAQCKLKTFTAEESTPANAIATNKYIAKLDHERAENLKKIPYKLLWRI